MNWFIKIRLTTVEVHYFIYFVSKNIFISKNGWMCLLISKAADAVIDNNNDDEITLSANLMICYMIFLYIVLLF